ncbi:tetratricopeptide repeat protein [Flammeovirga sp. EKP202]|uniref:tetratricopeptide repeat protein n=1 Tax=Flammeovirga sp. EKP202 TaxID=2770592 RepID=UPI00165F4CDB|nr:tetratricopeptide repeat protein [Flammeovirga sp. EKP202]MBD0403001.1 tetratricopeptide repeat protein [Flammeovirga sp. EKP202]
MFRKTLILGLFLLLSQFLYAQDTIIDSEKINKAIDYYQQAKADYSIKAYDKALNNFILAYELNPNFSDYSYGVASSYYELKDYENAKKYIELTIKLQTGQADYHLKAGNIYFKLKDFRKAVRNYEITLANLNPEIPINTQSCYYNKAVSHYYLKDYTNAIHDLSVLIEEDQENYNAIHLRAVSYLRLGKMEDACVGFHTAKELGNLKSQEYIDKHCQSN